MGSKQKNSPEKTLNIAHSDAPKVTAPAASPKVASGGRTGESAPSKIRELGQYFEDAKKELGKVSWPTNKEVKATSLAVLALVCIMSFFLGIVDLLLTKIVASILSIGF